MQNGAVLAAKLLRSTLRNAQTSCEPAFNPRPACCMFQCHLTPWEAVLSVSALLSLSDGRGLLRRNSENDAELGLPTVITLKFLCVA